MTDHTRIKTHYAREYNEGFNGYWNALLSTTTMCGKTFEGCPWFVIRGHDVDIYAVEHEKNPQMVEPVATCKRCAKYTGPKV